MITNYFKSEYIVKRPVITNDGGIANETFEQIGGTVSGGIRLLNGGEVLNNERLGKVTSHRFYCGVIDIKDNDIVTNTTEGKDYRVKLVNNLMNMDRLLQVDCEYQTYGDAVSVLSMSDIIVNG